MAATEAPWPLAPREAFARLRADLRQHVFGQDDLVHRLLLALLADGHVMLESAPGMAKTRAVTLLASRIEAHFLRFAFTAGTTAEEVRRSLFGTGAVTAARQRGVGSFPNIVLAEGLAHASPAARALLLDAMSERQVVIEGTVQRLPGVFLVCGTHTAVDGAPATGLATDESDRFLLHVRIGLPDLAVERRILDLARSEAQHATSHSPPDARMPLAVVLAARARVRTVQTGPRMLKRIASIVARTRRVAGQEDALTGLIARGAGPRGSLALERCARANAWLAGRRQVTERDIAEVVHAVLRHRIAASDVASGAGLDCDAILDRIMREA